MGSFANVTKRLFAFLVKEYGFQLVSKDCRSSLDSITYEKKPLTIELGWYKGEIDISFHVDLENDIFRPYISRTFMLSEIALRQDKDAYRDAPSFPDYITTLAQAKAMLKFTAGIMKKHCDLPYGWWARRPPHP
jgi:hypothetical protein